MYLIASAMPIYKEGKRLYISNSWYNAALTARDGWAAGFGKLVIIAPCKPLNDQKEMLECVESLDGVEFIPVSNAECRFDQFWIRERKIWMDVINSYLEKTDVLHSSIGGLYKPLTQFALFAAYKLNIPTVLVGSDRDMHEVWRDRLRNGSLIESTLRKLHLIAIDRVSSYHMARADLTLLKEGSVHERYSKYAAHPKAFCDTMYSVKDVITETVLNKRIDSIRTGRPLRLVYCGRLIHLKGIHISLHLIKRLLQKGVQVEYDIIGNGPEELSLKKLAADLDIMREVRFLGVFPYNSTLIKMLYGYDIMLYTPVEEDTPRMVFDAYAAGLPTVGADIPFLSERSSIDRASITFPILDVETGSDVIVRLNRDRDELAEMMRRARLAGQYHASENWNAKRRQWTIEAIQRRRCNTH